ncbi:MAG: hypothetical protein R2771_05765 [Saprospiraceae bacterium]
MEWCSCMGVTCGELSGGHGNTDSDGTFSGLVPKGLALELRIYSMPVIATGIERSGLCPEYWDLFEDTDIGDIVFEETDLQYLDVNVDFCKL